MHIVEINEHLDYNRFYQFPPEVHDITKAAGQRTWQMLHGLADHYPCPPCKPVFQTLASGIHDVVNIHLGKGVFDRKRWEQFTEIVHEAEKNMGCKGAKCHRSHETVDG